MSIYDITPLDNNNREYIRFLLRILFDLLINPNYQTPLALNGQESPGVLARDLNAFRTKDTTGNINKPFRLPTELIPGYYEFSAKLLEEFTHLAGESLFEDGIEARQVNQYLYRLDHLFGLNTVVLIRTFYDEVTNKTVCFWDIRLKLLGSPELDHFTNEVAKILKFNQDAFAISETTELYREDEIKTFVAQQLHYELEQIAALITASKSSSRADIVITQTLDPKLATIYDSLVSTSGGQIIILDTSALLSTNHKVFILSTESLTTIADAVASAIKN